MGSVNGSDSYSMQRNGLIGKRGRFTARYSRREVRHSRGRKPYPTLVFNDVRFASDARKGDGHNVGRKVSFSDGAWINSIRPLTSGDLIEFDAKVSYSDYSDGISLSRPTKAEKIGDGAEWTARQERIEAEIKERDRRAQKEAWDKQQARYEAARLREEQRKSRAEWDRLQGNDFRSAPRMF